MRAHSHTPPPSEPQSDFGGKEKGECSQPYPAVLRTPVGLRGMAVSTSTPATSSSRAGTISKRCSMRSHASIEWSSSPACPAWARASSSASSRESPTRWGRTVHSLQWDVARPAFLSPAIVAKYPERDGVAHPIVRKGVGQWVRQAVLRWHRAHAGSADMLIGEVPLIGHRLLELVQVHADDTEPLLADAATLFATPVPSVAVRAAIERARARTFANPTNPRESADADIDIVQASWEEIHALAVGLGAAAAVAAPSPPFDPDAYAAVYRHLLRRRNALTLHVAVELAQSASVYDHAVEVTDIVPTAAEADSIAACESSPVARWPWPARPVPGRSRSSRSC